MKKKQKNIPIPSVKGNQALVTSRDNILQLVPYLLLAIYLLLVLLIVSNHEPWRDEAQAWLLARDTSVTQLLGILPSEGHPPLWYLLLMPLAKTGLPYASQSYLTAVIMIAAMYVLLLKTKLPLWLKCLLPFSYYMLYEYPAFARSYCLLVLFIALIVWLYPRRFSMPWLFALCIIGLFNTHVIAFTFALCLVVLYIADGIRLKIPGKAWQGAVALMLIGGLYLLPYLALSPMSDHFSKEIISPWANIPGVIRNGLIIEWHSSIAIVLFLVLVISVWQKPQLLLLLLGGMAGAVYILAFKYTGDLRHAGILFLIMIAVTALQKEYEYQYLPGFSKLANYGYIVLAIAIVLQAPSLNAYALDMEETYSDAKGAADFIMDNGLQNKIIAGYQAWPVSGILPYLPGTKRAWYAECQRYGSYYIYDSCFLQNNWQMGPEMALNFTHEQFKGRLKDIIVVLNLPLPPEAGKFVSLLYNTPETALKRDEMFYIYAFKDNVK